MPDSTLRQAELLADLGRYEEAAQELERAVAERPADPAAHTLLARVRLASGALAEALRAADAAVAAAPTDVEANVARGLVLADLGRVDEAAAQAERILRHGRGNGYACTSAAAVLARVRNGQVALDAAWEGVRLAPDQPRAHLVLGVVAAGLGLDDVAERAYHEASRLDPRLLTAEAPLGLAREEEHRYALALSRLGVGRRPASTGAGPADPTASLTDAAASPADPLRRLLDYGAGFAVLAPVLVACAAVAGAGGAAWAALLATAGVVGLAVGYRRLPAPTRAATPARVRAHPPLALAVGAVAAAPVALALTALSGSSWPLLVALAAGLVALVANRVARP